MNPNLNRGQFGGEEHGLPRHVVMKAMQRVHEEYAPRAAESQDYDDAEHRFHVGPETIMPTEIKRNPKYDPDHRELAPGEFAANNYRWPPHTAPEGAATHTMEFSYAANKPWRSLWGYNEHTDKMSLWMD